jgi:hypothetical protein
LEGRPFQSRWHFAERPVAGHFDKAIGVPSRRRRVGGQCGHADPLRLDLICTFFTPCLARLSRLGGINRRGSRRTGSAAAHDASCPDGTHPARRRHARVDDLEHVAPPRAAAPNAVDPDIVAGKTLLGFRVPVVVASPWSRGDAANPRVASTTFDHTSVLKLIEWRWSLPPLTARDASADVGNLRDVLDLKHPNPAVPALPMPAAPLPHPCPFPQLEESSFEALAARFLATP